MFRATYVKPHLHVQVLKTSTCTCKSEMKKCLSLFYRKQVRVLVQTFTCTPYLVPGSVYERACPLQVQVSGASTINQKSKI